MTTATASPESARVADFVNPVLRATREVFETMLGCTPKRVGLKIKDHVTSENSVSGLIGITGLTIGTISVRLPEDMAIEVLDRMTGTRADSVTPDVCDAVGELTNMIAGSAKAQLAHLDLSLSLPNVVTGSFDVSYPTEVQPFCVLFESDLGPFVIEAGFTKLS